MFTLHDPFEYRQFKDWFQIENDICSFLRTFNFCLCLFEWSLTILSSIFRYIMASRFIEQEKPAYLEKTPDLRSEKLKSLSITIAIEYTLPVVRLDPASSVLIDNVINSSWPTTLMHLTQNPLLDSVCIMLNDLTNDHFSAWNKHCFTSTKHQVKDNYIATITTSTTTTTATTTNNNKHINISVCFILQHVGFVCIRI